MKSKATPRKGFQKKKTYSNIRNNNNIFFFFV